MDEDQFWLLVSLQLSGEASEEELARLQELLKQHPEMGLRLQVLHGMWTGQPPAAGNRRAEALNKHLQRLSHHLSEPVLQYEDEPADIAADPAETLSPEQAKSKTWRILWPVTGVAASLTALFIMIHQWAPRKKPQCAQNTISTKPGSKSKIQLPDGSQVWLNADSRLTYDESFRGPSREVSLVGEAFFDIAKDKDHPFIIHAPSIDVRVLGTSLNIRSYSNDKNIETVLIRGSIEVTLLNSPEKKIVLQPNEKLVVQNDKASVSHTNAGAATDGPSYSKPVAVTIGRAHFREKDTVATEILWTKNKLAFDKESLEDVAMKIERWYNVKVNITDNRLRHIAYSGVFEEESLRQVMEALRLTGNFRYTINKKEITITP